MEKIHRGLYTEANNLLETGKDLPAWPVFVCSACGNTVLGAVQDNGLTRHRIVILNLANVSKNA